MFGICYLTKENEEKIQQINNRNTRFLKSHEKDHKLTGKNKRSVSNR